MQKKLPICHVAPSRSGSALVYILIAIALLAALTVTFMDSSSQQTSSSNAANLTTEMVSQINYIRSGIEECVLTYPEGDSVMPLAPATVGGQSPLRPYPLMPNNTYLSEQDAGNLVRNIGCPGNPGNSNNHEKIFSGRSGKFLPPKLNMFGEWVYYNDVDGVFFMTSTTATDPFLDAALKKVDSAFSKCETQYINNETGGAVSVTSDASRVCAGNSKCIVVRVRTTATSVFPGETGC